MRTIEKLQATIGVFQIESRAQMSMLPRLKPRVFYDLVIEVAIVRPGPIQGDMVHPYLRRREGIEPENYPTPELEKVLKKTLGIPLFQEQAMQVAMICAGFTAAEADQLRRAMATFKNTGTVSQFQRRLIEGMRANGYDETFAERIYQQLEGFGSYGFPESHAASFAILAYSSSWMKAEEPDVLLQPMRDGAEVVRDYNRLGLTLRDHPLTFLREDLRARDIITCRQALAAKDGKRLTVAGLVLVRQRPGSAEGVVFMTLEDETANMNVIIWPDLFDANRRVVLGGQMLAVKGMLQKEGEVVHLVAKEITDLSGLLADVGNRSSADTTVDIDSGSERLVVRSRNFH